MLFNSFGFLFFFPLVVILYFSIPYKWRWLMLLLASYFFYMCWRTEYALLLLASTSIDYFAGLKMSQIKEKAKRKKYLVFSIIANLGLLFSFKYFNFFTENVNLVLGVFNVFYQLPELKVLLPVGISFYTFQSLSYTIDLYRGSNRAEKHFGRFALYVSFFPQLVAGPIERSDSLLPQFREKHDFNYQNLLSGIKLMAWGFFKKVVIADRLGIFVNNVFNNPDDHVGISIWLASVFFAFQLYCDFSGYSDIAIGSARTMGYRLMKNFNRPFAARTFADFWDRWHISLNTWFRDYLLFALPVGKSKKWMKLRIYRNLVITILLIGLWHGANWTFVSWGALIAFYLLAESVSRKVRKRFYSWIGLYKVPFIHKYFDIFSIFILMTLSPLIFRANSMSDLFQLVANIFEQNRWWASFRIFTKDYMIFNMIMVFAFLTIEFIQEKYQLVKRIGQLHLVFRWGIYVLFFLSILLFGVFHEDQFIYFQF